MNKSLDILLIIIFSAFCILIISDIYFVQPKIEYVDNVIIKEVKVQPQFETYEVTFYTEGYESTGKVLGDKDYGVTSSGEPVIEGRTIACPESLAFGTAIYIKEMENVFYCTDRGSAITEGKLDIYTSDLEYAMEMGRHEMQVFILP
jgi:3D (Asp-Asp-Asp) domain-containing protein